MNTLVYKINNKTPLIECIRGIFERLVEAQNNGSATNKIKCYLAGGAAVHFYNSDRYTSDLDIEFSRRIYISKISNTFIDPSDNLEKRVFIDTSYNPFFSLLHEDYQLDSLLIDLGVEGVELKILSPLDLAVSKLSRYSPIDSNDIASLCQLGFFTSEELKKRAYEALSAYPGSPNMIKIDIDKAVENCAKIEASSSTAPDFK